MAKRVYNIREGWQPADDWLPDRLLNEPLTLPSGREARLTPERLRAMIEAYYKARGLDSHGPPALVNRESTCCWPYPGPGGYCRVWLSLPRRARGR